VRLAEVDESLPKMAPLSVLRDDQQEPLIDDFMLMLP